MTCGPTCLHALYRYYGEDVGLDQVIGEVESLEAGGTLAVSLARHALGRGYGATIFTYNLRIFDPTWFAGDPSALPAKLEARGRARSSDVKLRFAIDSYLDFLARGGRLRYEDLSDTVIQRYVERGRPVLTGLSATYLYASARERDDDFDDVDGDPTGHFVVLCGYDEAARVVQVADPLHDNPGFGAQYTVAFPRLLGAIYLGVLTYDANLLVIEPP